MKSLVLTGCALTVLAAAPALAPSIAHADDSWTGWYAGLNAGGAWGKSEQRSVVDPATNTYFASTSITSIDADGNRRLNDSGFTGGAQLGYNSQMGNMVIGVEADINALDLSKTSTVTTTYPCCGPSTYTLMQGTKTSWMFTARPRIGWTADNWLIYGTGGVAVADVKATQRFTDNYTASPGGQESASKNGNRTGWTAGLGAEVGMSDGWSMKGEWLYADFGKQSFSGAMTNPASATTFNNSADLKVNLFRLGINKRF